MNTIDDIQFNEQLFSQFDSFVVLLYQLSNVGLAIPLSNLNLLSFIRPYNQISDCQDHITNMKRKTFTLFIYSENIKIWLRNNNIKHNIEDIIIFCSFEDERKYFRDWTRRYTAKVKNIITWNELEREILISGMKYINNLCLDLKENEEILILLKTYHNQLRLALIDVLRQPTNNS